MAKYISFLLVVCVINSCSTAHYIKIFPDGSAIVESDSYFKDSMRFANSKVISGFEFQEKKLLFRFKIENVDSLGTYMGDIISDDYFTFKWNQDSLIISSNYNSPIKQKYDDNRCCGYTIGIESASRIIRAIKNGEVINIKRKGDNKILIFWDLNHRKDINSRAKDVVVFFE